MHSIERRFEALNVTVEQHFDIQVLRRAIIETARAIDGFCPDGREKSLALTKLEEAAMWATKAISHHEVTAS